MRKFNVVVVIMAVSLLAALPVFAAEQARSPMDQSSDSQGAGKSSQSHDSKTMSQSQSHAFNAKDLIGKSVRNKQDEELGKVEDLIIGQDGNTEFVILSRGGTLGVGAKYVPVPFKIFFPDATNISKISTDNDVIANLDKGKLDSAPSFNDRKINLSDQNSQDKICSHFGQGACPHAVM